MLADFKALTRSALSVAVRCRISVALTAWLVLISLGSWSAAAEDSVPDATRPRPEKIFRPVVIEMRGEIDGKLTQYFNSRMQRAEAAGADLLIIEIDSPGGLKIESLEMARTLRDCKWAYTVAIVSNEAISGAALISLGCDEIFIDPNAKFGDIGEIAFDAEQFAWRLIEPKIESYLSRDARDLAESKGRPADLAEAMVDKDVLVYQQPLDAQPADDATGIAKPRFKFKSVRSDAKEQPAEPWKLIQETGPERFLTLSGQRAKELGVAQHFAESTDDLADEFGYDRAKVSRYRFTTADGFAFHLNRPLITGLLIVLGMTALYFELSAPGIGIGGLVSGLCAVLFFWSRFFAGTSGWLEVILFLSGLVFIAMELFIIPGFGLPGLLGIVLLLGSVLMASQSFVIPETPVEWNQLTTSALVMVCSGMLFLIAAIFISRRLGSLPLLNRLILAPSEREVDASDKGSDGKAPAVDHPLVSVGDWGVAESVLRPAGRAKFGGRSVNVVSDGSYIEPGQQVKVVRVSGNIVKVAVVDE